MQPGEICLRLGRPNFHEAIQDSENRANFENDTREVLH